MGIICFIFAPIFVYFYNLFLCKLKKSLDMRKSILFLVLAMLVCCTGVLSAKKPKTVYIIGVSYSFSDSVVYFTEIQKMENIVFSDAHKFLPDRQHYSYELSDFMESSEGLPGRVSALYYDDKISSLQKKADKLKRRFIRKS